MKSITRSLAAFIAIVIMIALDQITKLIAVNTLKGNNPFVIINNVFELSYLENHGAAFSMLQGKQTFFTILTIVVMIICIFAYIKLLPHNQFLWLRVAIVFLVAGAIGNFIDRFRQGYVVDFFYFKLINFPVFNVADIYVTIAAILFCILVIFVYKDDDFKGVFSK